MAEVYLALGSNVGDGVLQITHAQAGLLEFIECAVSAPLYRTKAYGYTDQADFVNTVVSGQTTLEPKELLKQLKALERSLGREERFRWGPREIDIDIVLYGDTVLDEPELIIPHIGLPERDFVLRPLCDLDKGLIDPRSKTSVSELLTKILPENRTLLG